MSSVSHGLPNLLFIISVTYYVMPHLLSYYQLFHALCMSLPVTQQHQQVAVVHHENSLFHFLKTFVYFVPYFTVFLLFYSAAELVTLQGDN